MEQVLKRKISSLSPDPEARVIVEAEMDRYGTEDHEREVTRVRLAILKLAGADREKVQAFVDAAKGDYRDVLAWAEIPNFMKDETFDDSIQDELKAKDQKQYEEWLEE